MIDVEKLRAFIERAERADNIVVADERFRAERYLWNNRSAILALAEREQQLIRIEAAARKVTASASTLDPDLPEDANVHAPYLAELRVALGEEKS